MQGVKPADLNRAIEKFFDYVPAERRPLASRALKASRTAGVSAVGCVLTTIAALDTSPEMADAERAEVLARYLTPTDAKLVSANAGLFKVPTTAGAE